MSEKKQRDEAREHRIAYEAIVDAYGPEEQAMGWYYYLAEKYSFPFTAACIAWRVISPLQKGDEVEMVVLVGKVQPGREIDRMIELITDVNLEYGVLLSIYPVSAADYASIDSPLLLNVRREGKAA